MKKKVIGIAIFAVLIAVIVGLKVISNMNGGSISGKVTTIYVATGGGKEDFIADEEVNKILTSAQAAPTGCNFQPVRILVLNTDESLKKLKNCTRCHFDAPTAFLICYNENESWVRPYDGTLSAPVDASIVTTHMMLQAETMASAVAGVCILTLRK